MEDCNISSNVNSDSVMPDQLWTKMAETLQSGVEYFKLTEKCEMTVQFANSHPLIALFLSMLAAMSLVPIICFCMFALISMVILLASGLFLEAILLSVGMMMLLGVITLLGFVALALTCGASITYYCFYFAQRLMKNVVDNKKPRVD